jgi:diguanylate cyclase (GGDEF)-like protein
VALGLRVTISIGVAQMREADPDFAAVLARADAAMYRAKQGGRNRVVSDETA